MTLYTSIPVILLIIIFYIIWVWKKCPFAISTSLLFIIEMTWGLISIVWIDNGVYISEQLRTSYFTGASIRYFVLMLPFAILFPLLTQKNIEKNMKYGIRPMKLTYSGHALDLIALCIITATILYSYLNIFVSGVPLFRNYISKSNFFAQYSRLPFANTVYQYLFPFAMFLSGAIFCNGNSYRRRWGAILGASIMLFQVLLEYKFYGLYNFAIYFSMPILIKKSNIFLKKRKIPFKAIILSVFGVGVLLFICYSQYSKTQANPVQYLLNRIFALQSHTFWGVDLLVKNKEAGFNWDVLVSEIIAGLRGASVYNTNFGIAKVMYEVTQYSYANDMIKTGFLFAGSYITVSLNYSGYVLTFLLSIGLAWALSKITAALSLYADGTNFVFLYLIFWVYTRIYEYFRVGSLSMILSWKMLIIYALLISLYLFRKSKSGMAGYGRI